MGTKKSEPAGAKKPVRAKAPARAKRTTAARKKVTPSHDEIATRAYFIAEESGGSDHVHNWLKAEDELSAG